MGQNGFSSVFLSISVIVYAHEHRQMSRLMRLWHLSPLVNLIFKTHAQQSNGAAYLIFGQTLRLLQYFMCANREGFGEPLLFACAISTIISRAGSNSMHCREFLFICLYNSFKAAKKTKTNIHKNLCRSRT